MEDPDRWQPLDLDRSIGQNGIELPDGVQLFVGSHWGSVTPFALDPDPANPAVGRTMAVAILMAFYWLTEAIPMAATALIPVVAFPLSLVAAGVVLYLMGSTTKAPSVERRTRSG